MQSFCIPSLIAYPASSGFSRPEDATLRRERNHCEQPVCFFDILVPSAYGFGYARVSSGKPCTGVAKIWLFGPHSTFSFIQPAPFASFFIYFIAKVLCRVGIRAKEINGALEQFSGTQGVRGTRTQPLICVGCSVHYWVSCAINKGGFFEIAFSSSLSSAHIRLI